ncbi:hypothetical protein H6783_03445 [Candidatus Nomurabacteria bacterium]|nr:hypothetical protein [Candidatus Nomurabacteria bacterium]
MNVPIQQKIQREKLYLFGALFVVLVLFVLYVYLLSASVAHVVIRKETNKDIQDMQTQISQLETVFIEKQHAISNEIATRHGFVESEHKIFIDRTTASVALSANIGR